MKLEIKNINNSLNKAYLAQCPFIDEITLFKNNYSTLLKSIKQNDSEETLKAYIHDFFKNTYYQGKFASKVNVNNIDFVILNGKEIDDKIGIIIETKAIKSLEMITINELNKKAFQELIQYYLEERVINENVEIKHLIITNSIDWFIFNATEFERLFYLNKSFLKKYNDWHSGKLVNKNKDWFYTEIAKPFIENEQETIICTHFQLTENFIENEQNLIELYKIFSPEHLLKRPFQNDSNTLNREFYNELLHIIGLQETKDKIQRLPVKQRNEGSLLENTILVLEQDEILLNLEQPTRYGETPEEQLFSISLELCLTWLNRIIFLKLLESQLIKYNKNKDFAFLNTSKINNFDDLKELFFEVLAVPTNERKSKISQKYLNVPYLNSSLFEQSPIEKETIRINQLKHNSEIPLLHSTVIRNEEGKRINENRNTLKYILEFLDSYNFASDNKVEIQEKNKTIINSSVLGLIFEKINGYKEGSFYTPGYITMYICRETIRNAVIQKFKNSKIEIFENIHSFKDLQNKIGKISIEQANEIFNSIRICDPAVGSGHFLVSALNELIAIKSELEILTDEEGTILQKTYCEVENDELFILSNSETFVYDFTDKKSQRIQETIFHEKQKLIENCIFGVDINPKSVNICRLRLWIELLKSAYYTKKSNFKELETLPNIDINIKCGNSLVSRFSLNGNRKSNLSPQKMQLATRKYKDAVIQYKGAVDKNSKRIAENLILQVKEQFSTFSNPTDKDYIEIGKIFNEINSNKIFFSSDEKTQWEIKVKRLENELTELQKRYDEKQKTIYGNPFEWRFEFPEILDDNGYFIGFDVVIGNPPYIRQELIKIFKPYFQTQYKVFNSVADILTYFIEQSYNILCKKGHFCFIISGKFARADYGQGLRKFLLQNCTLDKFIEFSGYKVFDSATVDTMIMSYKKGKTEKENIDFCRIYENFETENTNSYINKNSIQIPFQSLTEQAFIFEPLEIIAIRKRIEEIGKPLKLWNYQINRGVVTGLNDAFIIDSKTKIGMLCLEQMCDVNINMGIKTGLNEAFIIDEKTKNELIISDNKNSELIKPLLRGRDIHRYYPDYQNLWLICTFPSKKIDIEKYPIIKKHLLSFDKSRLEQTGKVGSRKKSGNKWFETQDNIAFWKNFEKPKLIYKDIAQELSFTFDDTGYYLLNTAYFLNVDNYNYYLLGVLNSKLIDWYYRNISVQLGQKGIRHFNIYIEQIPIKEPTSKEKTAIENLVKQILTQKKTDNNIDTLDLETKINKIVYEMYEISNDDIKLINKQHDK
jgi:hypothetical protein